MKESDLVIYICESVMFGECDYMSTLNSVIINSKEFEKTIKQAVSKFYSPNKEKIGEMFDLIFEKEEKRTSRKQALKYFYDSEDACVTNIFDLDIIRELVIKMSPAINGQKGSYVWIYRMDAFNEHINEIARNMLEYIWEDYLEQIC